MSVPAAASDAPAAPAKIMIGFQAEVTYLLQYGIARFLDDVQKRAGVNTLMLHCNPFEASWAGLDRARNPAGNFVTAHPQYYRDVKMEPHGLNPGDFDLPDAMRQISAETKKRGVKIIPWMEEDNRPRPPIKGMEELYEVDLYGRRTAGHPGGPCLNNPYFRNLIAAEIEDFIRSYDVDGLQRGTERQGPLGNGVGAWHHARRAIPATPPASANFLPPRPPSWALISSGSRRRFSRWNPTSGKDARGSVRGMDTTSSSGGYCCAHPELLVWETFWSNSMREMQREFSARAKTIKPGIEVGYHIWQNISFNPLYRAEQDYRPYTEYADFLKPALYDNPAASG